jgi:hypothetical protein
VGERLASAFRTFRGANVIRMPAPSDARDSVPNAQSIPARRVVAGEHGPVILLTREALELLPLMHRVVFCCGSRPNRDLSPAYFHHLLSICLGRLYDSVGAAADAGVITSDLEAALRNLKVLHASLTGGAVHLSQEPTELRVADRLTRLVTAANAALNER